MEDIVLVGAGGHCKVIIDIIRSNNNFNIVGIVENNKDLIKKSILDVPILGSDEILADIYNKGVRNAFNCVGGIKDISIRNKIYRRLKDIGFNMPLLVHSTAIVSPYAKVGEGTCIMAGAVINSGASIGEDCIINTSSIIEHDCRIGNNTHVSPGVCISGGVIIGNNTHIGIGSSIIQGVHIGSNVVVGAGSVIINNINDNTTAVGVPAKIIKCR